MDEFDDTRLDDRLRSQLRAIEVGGPPLGVVHQRVLRLSAERRRRRRFSWVAGAVALLAVPGGAATLGLASSDGSSGTRLEVNPGPDDADGVGVAEPVAGPGATTTTVPAPARAVTSARSASTPAAPVALPGGPTTTIPAEAPATPANPGPSSSTSSGTEGSEDEGCVVEGYDDKSVYVPNGGAGAGAAPSCTYTATRAGGYVADGSWILEIEGSSFRRLSGDRSPACAAVGLIQPGDRVKATVRGGLETASSPGFVRVGPRWHC